MIPDDYVAFGRIRPAIGATGSSPRHIYAGITVRNRVVSKRHVASASSYINAGKWASCKITTVHCYCPNIANLDTIVSWICRSAARDDSAFATSGLVVKRGDILPGRAINRALRKLGSLACGYTYADRR